MARFTRNSQHLRVMTRTSLGGGGLHLFWYVFPLALLPYLVLAWPLLNTVAGASAYALITALGGAVAARSARRYNVAALTSPLLHWRYWVFYGLALPLYVGVVPSVVLYTRRPCATGALALVLALAKVGVCMSVCLHRYAAHRAFDADPPVRLGLGVIGTLAMQGGPIWWASMHRRHHRHCDGARDPHSPVQVGVLGAFAFFARPEYLDVDETFAPAHCDSAAMRVLDRWCFVPVAVEWSVAYALVGPVGLWVACVSSAYCQCLTLGFNVNNHPKSALADGAGCRAIDSAGDDDAAKGASAMHTLQSFNLLGEGAHKHHHVHPALWRRPGLDAPQLFVRFLFASGLVHTRS